jgi:hypothetical protein
LLVAAAVLIDGRKMVVAVTPGYRESVARVREGRRDVRQGLGTDGDLLPLPKEHWVHLRTTNVVESPFAALRLRTDAAKRFKQVERATAVIWKMLMVDEKRFRRLNAPELLAEVYAGTRYEDGIEVAREGTAA